MKLQVGVKILLKNEQGEILLIQRAGKMDDGEIYWDIPGGRIGEDEPLVDALAREIKEETGLTLSQPPTLLAAQDIFAPKADLHVVRLTYYGIIEGEVTLSDEHQAFKWIPYEGALQEAIDPYLRKVLEEASGRI